MKNIFDDPLCGILMGISGCFCGFGIFIRQDSAAGTFALIMMMVFIALFFIRVIRILRKKAYNPPPRWIPAMKLADAALWLIVIIMWWNEVNNSDLPVGIGMMIILMIHSAREIYEAVKLFVMKSRKR